MSATTPLTWCGSQCLLCRSEELCRPLQLPLQRRVLTKYLELTVFTHTAGPQQRKHNPMLCLSCGALYFHNFVVPGVDYSHRVQIRLVGDPSTYVCIHVGWTACAFSVDLLRHFECQIQHSATSFEAYWHSYTRYWNCRDWDTPWTVRLLMNTSRRGFYSHMVTRSLWL